LNKCESVEHGTARSIYLPRTLDQQVEETLKKLGWSRSYLFKYALTKLLQELSVLTTTVHEDDIHAKEAAVE